MAEKFKWQGKTCIGAKLIKDWPWAKYDYACKVADLPKQQQLTILLMDGDVVICLGDPKNIKKMKDISWEYDSFKKEMLDFFRMVDESS